MNSTHKSNTIISPAKINLGLSIPYKRPDGYHQIESFFIPLKWGDSISFHFNDNFQFELISQNNLEGESRSQFENVSERGDLTKNLLFKTYEWIKKFIPSLKGITCILDKKIPTGGGLGGGSSNAGSLINFIFSNINLNNDLINIITLESKLLGADVPFFTQNQACFVTGIGEILTPIPPIQGFGILCIPGFPLDTKMMFQSLRRNSQNPSNQNDSPFVKNHLNDIIQGNWEKLRTTLKNEFEEVALIQNPVIGRLKSALYEKGCLYASMSGSGSSLYGIVSSFPTSIQLSQSLSIEYPSCNWIPFEY
jgi:4-diphosphocytidyl-2-C-methyl-D-erythritol kinase